MFTTSLEFLRKNQWIILASIFFIIWKLFLVGILWEGRSVAPEPDDSYEYIARIAAVSDCHSDLFCPYAGVSMADHSGFAYLSYGLIFGLIGKIFSLAPEKTFHLGFYLGTLLLALILPFFLASFTSRRPLIALSILFLAFYHGTGESHGFFWVVPSFFSLILFFILYRFITNKDQQPSSYCIATIFSVIYAFMHPISIYLIFFFPIYLAISFYFTKKYSVSEIRRTLFVIFIVLGSASIQSQYLARTSQQNYYGLGSSLEQTRQIINDFTHDGRSGYRPEYNVVEIGEVSFFTTRIATLNATYFRYILPHWIMIFPFILALWILYFRHEFRLLTFYLSALLFFVTATLFHEFGFRSAIILWPATYILAAFSIGHTYALIKERSPGTLQRIGKFLVIIFIIIFFLINALFSIGYNLNVNSRNNFEIDESFTTSLLSRMEQNDHIGLDVVLVRTRAGSKLFLNGKVSPQSNQPRFIARIDRPAKDKTGNHLSFVRKISSEAAYRLGILPRDTKPKQNDMLLPIEGYHLDSRFGDISIFEKN